MKPATVAVLMEDDGLAKDLARGLAENGEHLLIEILRPGDAENSGKRYEVLVTDFEEKDGLTDGFEPSKVVRIGDSPYRISKIYGRIMDIASGQRTMHGSTSDAAAVITVNSPWGGSGATSLAVTAGRMLAGAYGEKVLYVPLTWQDGSLEYRDPAGLRIKKEGSERIHSVKELVYRLKNERPVFWPNFTVTDEYGLEYLWCGEKENELLLLEEAEQACVFRHLQESGSYGWIIADVGNQTAESEYLHSSVSVTADSQMDSRMIKERADEAAGKGISVLVKNHGLENRVYDRGGEAVNFSAAAELIHDGESFVSRDDGWTEIIMSKSYAVGVKIFSELLLELASKRAETD